MNTYKLRKWFKKRFNRMPSQNRQYYEEWKQRYQRSYGAFIAHMDYKSLQIWYNIKYNNRNIPEHQLKYFRNQDIKLEVEP